MAEPATYTTTTTTTTAKITTGESSEHRTQPATIPFLCALCGMNETCDYRGRRPPFANKIELTEDAYVMRDPFAPPPSAVSDQPASEHYLVLGADCNLCRRTVCKATECSFFYGVTFCRQCSMKRVPEFPLEVRSKIKKQFS